MTLFQEAIVAKSVIGVYKEYKPQDRYEDRNLVFTRLRAYAERYSRGVPLISRLDGAKATKEINTARIILEKVCEEQGYVNQRSRKNGED